MLVCCCEEADVMPVALALERDSAGKVPYHVATEIWAVKNLG
jgi:hypothetical protein